MCGHRRSQGRKGVGLTSIKVTNQKPTMILKFSCTGTNSMLIRSASFRRLGLCRSVSVNSPSVLTSLNLKLWSAGLPGGSDLLLV